MPDKKPYLDSAGLTTVVNNIKSQFAKKADLSTKSDTGHTHDNRYYTETEIDNKLAQKSDLGHTHDKLVLDSVELTMDKIANDNYAFYPQVLSSQISESTSIQGCSLGISASPWTSLYAKDIILEGTHLSTKFSDIDSSISSLNTALSGKANTNHTHSIANVTNLQTTLDGKAAKSHTHTVSQISDLTATAKELNYMDGVTSGVQGQLDSLSAVVAGKSDSNHTHTVATTTAAGFMSANDKSKLDNIANNANNYSLPAAGTSLGGVKTGGDVTITNGLISVNDNSHTHIISNVSGLQDELNGKASASHSHDDRYYTEAEIDAKINAIVGEGAAETLDTIGEISSAIQENQTMLDTLNDAIGKKQNTITGAATTIANANLTTNRALVSNGSGKVGVSAVTATELGYLDGVTSNVQSQLDGKANSSHTQTLSTITDVTATAAELNKLDGATVSTSEINNLIGSTSNIQTQLNGKVSNTQAGVNAAINLLGTGSDIPSDNDYYISQYVNGGTTTTTYHRRPVVKLYEYIKTKLESVFAAKSHTHNYAGSSSAGGSATSAVKLDTSAGSATQPVYFADGKPVKTTYTLGASVPSGAKFTDTTYGAATTSAAGLMSAADKTKLNGIATGAEVNQNAFAKVVVGETEIVADAKSDSISLVAGSNVTLTPNAANDSVTITAKDTVYTHPTSGVTAGTYKSVTVNAAGHVTGGSNPTTLSGYGITDAAAKSHTHTVSQITDLTATAAELNKLDGVTATTAELNYVDGVTSNIQSQLDSKAASGHTHSNYASTVSTTGSGNAITAISQSGNTITATKGSTFSLSNHTHNYAGSSSAGGSATSAVKLATARNITLSGDVAGTASFNGEADASISTTVSSMHGVTTAGTGAAYTATVSGITALTAGVSFIMIPHTYSTTTAPTLNVNGLGAKGLRMRGSSGTGTAMSASLAAWVASGRPVQVTYNGIYWVTEAARPSASDLSGTVAIASGGTGATTAADARVNLGLRVDADYDADFTVGTQSINNKSCGYAKMSSGNAYFQVMEDSTGKYGQFNLDYILGGTADRSIPVAYNLYSNASGTTGTITLSDSAANYDYLEIYTMLRDGVCAPLMKVRTPDGKTADLNWSGVWSSGNVAVARARVVISGTSITFNSNYQVTMPSSGSHTVSTNVANLIYITRVVGYKFGYSQYYE